MSQNLNKGKVIFKSLFLFVVGCALVLPITGKFFSRASLETKAETGEHGEEQEASSYWISEIPNFKANNASLNSEGRLANQNNGRYYFDYEFTNVEVKGNYQFTGIADTGNGSFTINLRSKVVEDGNAITDSALMSWVNYGYEVSFFQNGTYTLKKNKETLISTVSGASPIAVGSEVTYVYKVVDCEDGSAHISCKLNDVTLFDYYDTVNVINSGGIGGITNKINYYINSDTNMPVLEVHDYDQRYTGTTCRYKTLEEDGSIITDESISWLFSGAAVAHQVSGNKFAIHAKVTPTTDNSTIVLQLLAEDGTRKEEIAYPTMLEDEWGWKERGYLFYLFSNGSNGHAFLSRSTYGSYMVNKWGANLYADTTYDIEYSVAEFDYGDLITFKLNGETYLRYFDLKQDEYPEGKFAPIHIPRYEGSIIGDKATLTKYSGFYSYGSCVKFSFASASTEKKTVIAKDLGDPIAVGNSEFFNDGEIECLTFGDTVGYDINSNVLDISFKLKVNNLNSAISPQSFSVMLNYVGDSLYGSKSSSWTKKGYVFNWYSVSMFGINKNGKTLALGWTFNSIKITADTEYTIRVGEEVLADGSVHLYMLINGKSALNFVDGLEPANSAGWFALESGGLEGSCTQIGYEKPLFDLTTDTIYEDETLELNYVNPQPGDEFAYFIDERLSSADAIIKNDVIRPISGGTLAIYVVVNGVASEITNITIIEYTKALISISNEKVVVGSTTAVLTASISDDTPIESSSFVVEPVTGEAIIDQETGVLTGTKAGTVKVYSVVNGLTSSPIIVYITPQVYVEDAYALALGGSRVLRYSSNCELPDEEITEIYEIVDGNENCTYDPETHVITGTQLGVVKIRVKVIGETFMAVSGVVEISVEKPIVVISTEVKDMIVGNTQIIDASINHGEIDIVTQDIIIEEGESLVEVNGLSIKALKPGHVKFHVVLNGLIGVSEKFTITKLIGVIEASDMRIKTSQRLNVKFNDFSLEISSVKYSIKSGGDLATIKDNVLKAKNRAGTVVVQALVNNKIKVTKSIEIFSDVEIVPTFDPTKNIYAGEEYYVFFNYYGKDKIKEIKLSVKKPGALKTQQIEIDNDGEKKVGFSIKPNRVGKNSFYLIVNGKESRVVEFNVVRKPGSKDYTGLIVGLSVGGGIVVSGGVFSAIYFPVRKAKRLKGVTK